MDSNTFAVRENDSLPKPTKDGRWIIGYDEVWDPIIIDDIESLDPLTRASLSLQQENCDLKIFGEKTNSNVNNSDIPIPLPFYDLNNESQQSSSRKWGDDYCINGFSFGEDEVVCAGIAGMTNLGNTCFINSGLQCLFNNSKLVDYFLNSDFSENGAAVEHSISACFSMLMKQVWNKERKEKTIKSVEFKDSLAKIFPQFKDYRQHDCQEFLALLLSALHDELKIANDENISSPSSSSSTSSHSPSSSSNGESDELRRQQPIPETIKSFNSIVLPLLEKNTKTLNTNVAKIEDENKNNKLNFNSFKFPKLRRKDVDNLVVDNLRTEDVNDENGLKGLKRLKDTNVKKEGEKRQKLVNMERNVETEDDIEEDDEDQAIDEWNEYLGFNKRSIIVDTFQGQFKSTIKCSNCDHISVTYEPFMYLPLPIPDALQKQLVVTLINCSSFDYYSRQQTQTKYSISCHKYDRVLKIIENLKKLVKEDEREKEVDHLCLAQVQDNYIVKILDNQTFLRNLDQSESICAFSLSGSSATVPIGPSIDLFGPQNDQEVFYGPVRCLTCSICLEEKSTLDLLIHESICDCKLCSHCLEMLVSHYCKEKPTFLCPICSISLTKENFYSMASFDSKDSNITASASNNNSSVIIPLLFRICDENLTWERYKLISHPLLIQLVNVINGSELYEIVDRLVPYPCPYSLHFVDRKGQQCSRCFCSSSCGGCEISRYGQVTLNSEDSIALQFDSSFDLNSFPTDTNTVNTNSTTTSSPQSSTELFSSPPCLTLNDCLNAFSQSETLDEDNPWFCPVCASNQRARKSLSIWRCPDTLMVYMKRFVFHEMQSIKVDDPVSFPIDSLDLSPFVKGPKEDHVYSLQSLICHSGGVNSGHYTAFSKHYTTQEWNYFNDEFVSKQEPDCNDDRAYILFYQKPSKFERNCSKRQLNCETAAVKIGNESELEAAAEKVSDCERLLKIKEEKDENEKMV